MLWPILVLETGKLQNLKLELNPGRSEKGTKVRIRVWKTEKLLEGKRVYLKVLRKGNVNPERQQNYGTNLRALDCKYLFWIEGHLSIDSDRPSEEQPSVRKLRSAQGSR